MLKAPIVFFAYKRPEHTQRSLESLSQNIGAKDSKLFIYCDGIKRIEDSPSVELVRQIVRSKQWCGTVHIIEREQNIGLANSVIHGVTELCNKYGKVIVLEDDLVLSPFFLEYMNKALDIYEQESRVIQISGYMFPVKLESVNDAIFLPFTTSWGWATWQRAWKYFDPTMSGYALLKNNRELKYRFNLNNSYAYFEMLEQQINAKIDSWAIRWYLSTFIINGLTLYPIYTLVKNIGFDGSGTHCQASLQIESEVYQDKILFMPSEVKVDFAANDKLFKHLQHLNQPLSLLLRIRQKMMVLFAKIKYVKV